MQNNNMDNETFTAYIYQIYDHWDGLKYIGSTTKSIKQRLKQHECKYKSYKQCTSNVYTTSYKVLCNGDYDISTLETVQIKSVKELRTIEGKSIQAINCVNRNVAGRTDKQYRCDNKKKINEAHKIYCEQNAEQIKAKKILKQQSDALKWDAGDMTIK
jgi:hypothetical protein